VVPDDSFDSASHGEQITITSGGGIELETEWKRFRAQRRRKTDPGQAAELNGCVFRERKTSVTLLPPTWNVD
jgi:hypothetical protein